MSAESKSVLPLRPLVMLGVAVLAIYVGGFGAWGAFAPIAGAVIAEGTVVARGQNKAIQHYEGGIVKDIMVREGDRVAKGAPLFALEPTFSEAQLIKLKTEYADMAGRRARLLAERDLLSSIEFPEKLLEHKDLPEISRILVDQRREFEAKRAKMSADLDVYQQKNKTLAKEIHANEDQVKWLVKQIELVAEEIEAVEKLNSKQLAPLDRLMLLKRKHAELNAQLVETRGRKDKAEETIKENDLQIITVRDKYVESAAVDLSEVNTKLLTREQEIRAALDVFERAVVRAPVDGIVVRLKAHTIGGVVNKGDTILEILPVPADLIVEAKIRPEDIDRVRPGFKARVRFSALDLIYMPPFEAKLEYISADKLQDEQDRKDNKFYYLARISDITLPVDINRERIYAGMPVEAFIVTQQRTFFGYLFRPLQESLNRSWREK